MSRHRSSLQAARRAFAARPFCITAMLDSMRIRTPPPARATAAVEHPQAGATERHFADGWAALSRGQYLQAASAFQTSVRAAPSGPIAEDALYWQGVALARAGQRSESISILSDFVRVHRSSPRCGEASSILGWQLLQAGRAEEAEPHLRRALLDPRREIRETAQAGLAALAQAPGSLDGGAR